jgi:lipopolysaccharide/colanic/teichoic acid biosynthesis glycosyltransferase
MTQHCAEMSFAGTAVPAHHPARRPGLRPVAAPWPRRPGGLYRALLKRALDIALVLSTAPIVLPLLLILALFAASDGHSPFYRQARVGRGGRSFQILKLRSMVPDAEDRLARHLAEDPAAAAEWARCQKLARDPRITPVGHLLRRSSLDELPQLWNVLIGDMALVGPRPMLPDQQPLYSGTAYYRLRPGLTGLWQISERHTSAFTDRATYDTDYAARLSFGLDLAILARTVGVVLRQTGA